MRVDTAPRTVRVPLHSADTLWQQRIGLLIPEDAEFVVSTPRCLSDSRSLAQPSKMETGPGSLKGFETPQIVAEPVPAVAEVRQMMLQRWQGRVVRVESDAKEFTAVLHDITDPSRPTERAIISLDEVVAEDQNLIREGALFYWYIFYETRQGTRRTVYELRFRRLAKWTKGELDRITQRVASRAGKLGITEERPAGSDRS